jgi:hypothetical protein
MCTLQNTTSELAARGAIIEICGVTPEHFLVGEFAWLDAHRIFWFIAHGDRENDGGVLEFDRAEVIDGHSVQFVKGARRIARLTDIASSAVDDPEDHRVAFALWQQVAPCARALIQRSRAHYESEAGPGAQALRAEVRDGSNEVFQ